MAKEDGGNIKVAQIPPYVFLVSTLWRITIDNVLLSLTHLLFLSHHRAVLSGHSIGDVQPFDQWSIAYQYRS